MTTSPTTAAISALVAPIVADLKLDLYDLEFNGGQLKITVDTLPGSPDRINLDQLALVTRLVSRDLDHHDPIPGHYTLEVSSPGLERHLRTAAHFQRALGATVSIRLRSAVDGERRVQGVLVAADDNSATVRADDGRERIVPLDTIDRARTVFQWEKGPKKAASNKPSGASPKATSAARIKPAPGPSDELDPPTFEEATA